MTLSDYIMDVRRILRDAGTAHPTADIIAFINEARHQRDLDTRLVRKVVGFSFITNQAQYPLGDIEAGTFIRGDAQFSNAREIVSVYVIPQGVAGGLGVRYPLGRQPYSKIGFLTSQSWPSYPSVYALLGHSTVVVGPPPAQAYPAEWDLVGIYPDLVNLDDVEPMPDPYNDPLPYLAAANAKYNQQRYDEGALLEGLYNASARRIGMGIRAFAIPNPGFDLPLRRR